MLLATLLHTCRARKRKWGAVCMILIGLTTLWGTLLNTKSSGQRSGRLRPFREQDWLDAQVGSAGRRKSILPESLANFRWFASPKKRIWENEPYLAEEKNYLDFNGGATYDDIVSSVNSSVLKEMLHYPLRKYSERVLILTPIHNAAEKLPNYAKVLKSLSYPRELISVALGEDSSTDDTMTAAERISKNLQKYFNKVKTFHLNITGGVHGDWKTVHDPDMQFERRSHLADARNKLLKAGLEDEEWVLWIDSDIGEMPRDIIQQLLSAKKDIVAPLCAMKDADTGDKRVYDKNTWRETAASLRWQKSLGPRALVLEGYGPSHRKWLSDLRHEGRVVPLDGVGGCTLLIRAVCHRKGLTFPTDIYDHHIETEGLAKMARKMHFGVYGMPFVEVMHS